MLLPLAGVMIVLTSSSSPQSQHLDIAEDRQTFVNQAHDALDIAAAAQDPELGAQNVVIRRRNRAAEQMLDHFEALVHGLLDQRVTRERPITKSPGTVDSNLRRKLRQRVCFGR